jgi:hypothetical protein
MTTPTIDAIEAAIEQLSPPEQQRLLERLAGRFRAFNQRSPAVPEADLAAMADDPAIQDELRRIEAEFAATEADGLQAE